jgi:hypothetical protein
METDLRTGVIHHALGWRFGPLHSSPFLRRARFIAAIADLSAPSRTSHIPPLSHITITCRIETILNLVTIMYRQAS